MRRFTLFFILSTAIVLTGRGFGQPGIAKCRLIRRNNARVD